MTSFFAATDRLLEANEFARTFNRLGSVSVDEEERNDSFLVLKT